jgi:hypothetical protein
MPNHVELETKWNDWRLITNEIIDEVGNIDGLSTTDKTSVVIAVNELKSSIDDISNDIGDLGTLTTTDTSKIVNAINELDLIISGLSNEDITLSNKIGDLGTLTTVQTSLVNAINELNTSKALAKDLSYINIDDNNGRFATETGVTATTTSSGKYFNAYNSSSLSIVDKFIDDNSTNGGGGSALPANIISLTTKLSAEGRTDMRYGYEFYVLDITAGSGTTDGVNVSGTDYYPIISTNRERLGRIGSTMTWQGWVKVSSSGDTLILGDALTTLTVDGTTQTAPFAITEGTGWHWVEMVKTLVNEYDNFFPSIKCEDTTIAHIALSGYFDGDVSVPPHLSLI